MKQNETKWNESKWKEKKKKGREPREQINHVERLIYHSLFLSIWIGKNDVH